MTKSFRSVPTEQLESGVSWSRCQETFWGIAWDLNPARIIAQFIFPLLSSALSATRTAHFCGHAAGGMVFKIASHYDGLGLVHLALSENLLPDTCSKKRALSGF